MPLFFYQAKDSSGKTLEGRVEADSEKSAISQVSAKGLFVVSIQPVQSEGKTLKQRSIAGRVRLQDIALMTGQMADLLSAGLSVVKSLEIVISQTERKSLKNVVQTLYDRVKEGKSLSESLRAFPKLFDPFYVNMVRAGESGGTLDEIFRRLTVSLEKELELRSKVSQSMAYPIFVAGFGILTIGGILTFLIPRLAGIFSETGESLPFITSVVLAISEFCQNYWWILLIVIAALIILFIQASKQERLKQMMGAFVWKIPVLGTLMRKEDIARFARSLSMLLTNGVSILEALNVSENIVKNSLLTAEIKRINHDVNHGSSFPESLEKTNFSPPLFTNLAAIGEQTGALGESLMRVAEAYDKEVDRSTKTVTTLLGPSMILVIGLLIFLLLLSVLLPIFQINLLT